MVVVEIVAFAAGGRGGGLGGSGMVGMVAVAIVVVGGRGGNNDNTGDRPVDPSFQGNEGAEEENLPLCKPGTISFDGPYFVISLNFRWSWSW